MGFLIGANKMQEYPKMLYKDDLDNWRTAEDDKHETELRKDGYQSHDEIVNPKPKTTAKTTAKVKADDTTGTGH